MLLAALTRPGVLAIHRHSAIVRLLDSLHQQLLGGLLLGELGLGDTDDPDRIAMARQMLVHLGVTLADLQEDLAQRPDVPTVAEYLPQVQTAARKQATSEPSTRPSTRRKRRSASTQHIVSAAAGAIIACAESTYS